MAATMVRRRGRTHGVVRRIIVWVLILAGMGVMNYPFVMMSINTRAQADEVEQFNGGVVPLAVGYAEEINRAHEYNAQRATTPLTLSDPWTSDDVKDTPEYRDYLSYLSQTDQMATLTYPALNMTLPVYHGTGEDSLSRGLGHLVGTSLPVGGASTHSVFAGHTGVREYPMLDNLLNAREGDIFTVGSYVGDMNYQVVDIQVVLPDEVSVTQIHEGRDLVTLITCAPYGTNTHRLIVTGERIDDSVTDQPYDASREYVQHKKHEYIFYGSVVFLAVMILKALVGQRKRQHCEK